MATVIDELVLNLGLDPTKFTEGQRQAVAAMKQLVDEATKSGKETEAQSKKLLDFFTNLKREALGFLGAFYGGRGIKEVVEHLTQMDASAARLAPIFNTNTEALAKWRIAMREMGFSAGDADAAIGGLSQTIQDFITNPASAPQGLLTMLQRMGVPGETDPIKILEAAARFAQTPEMLAHPEQFESQMRSLLGLSPQMIQLLREAGEILPGAEKATPRGGGEGAFSKDFIQSMALFEVAAENLARVLEHLFVPTVQAFTDLFKGWLTPEGINFGKANEQLGDLATKGREQVEAALWSWLKSLFLGPGAAQPGTGVGPTVAPSEPKKVSGRNPGFAPGEEITGVQVYSDTVTPMGGAKSAAAVSNVTHDRSSRTSNSSTSEINIGTIHVNAPNAKDAPGIAESIKPALDSSLSAPVNN